jgi:hypothetical protein
MKWFRFHADALNNPKVQRLHPQVFRAWVNILCIACERSGTIPNVPDLAFLLRADEEFTQKAINTLLTARLIEKRGDVYAPHDWDEHQYRKASDDPERVKERVTRYRALRNAGVTRPDTDTDTETETDTEKEPPVAIATSPRGGKRATTKIPDDFEVTPDLREQAVTYGVPPEQIAFETEKWRDHHAAKGDVVKDAAASWRTWMRNAVTYAARGRASPNGQYKTAAEKHDDLLMRFMKGTDDGRAAEAGGIPVGGRLPPSNRG